MFKKILLFLLVVIVAFIAYVATRPAEFRVERSATIEAPADIVYANLADFRRWDEWSPWDKLDPDMKKTYEGAESGVGAGYHWEGNDEVGEGRMTIEDATPTDNVTIKLEFIKPWSATNTTTFDLAPADEGTRVTWAMEGQNSFMLKAMGVFMNMDDMIGRDFEEGLANLKAVVEAEARAAADTSATAS